MSPTYRWPRDGILRIKNDQWSVLAMVLIVGGALLLLLALLPRWGWEAPIPFSQALMALGMLCISSGVWVVLRRPDEIVIDPAERTIRLRGPIREVRFSFRDVSWIELQRSQTELVVADVPIMGTERYDVELRIVEGNHLTVHRGLDLSMACLRAQKLAAIMGRPMRRG